MHIFLYKLIYSYISLYSILYCIYHSLYSIWFYYISVCVCLHGNSAYSRGGTTNTSPAVLQTHSPLGRGAEKCIFKFGFLPHKLFLFSPPHSFKCQTPTQFLWKFEQLVRSVWKQNKPQHISPFGELSRRQHAFQSSDDSVFSSLGLGCGLKNSKHFFVHLCLIRAYFWLRWLNFLLLNYILNWSLVFKDIRWKCSSALTLFSLLRIQADRVGRFLIFLSAVFCLRYSPWQQSTALWPTRGNFFHCAWKNEHHWEILKLLLFPLSWCLTGSSSPLPLLLVGGWMLEHLRLMA